MRTLVLSHETGLRAHQVDTFPADNLNEIYIGRDPTCAVVYPESLDAVSRKHAKIVQDQEDPYQLGLLDLGSSNGTFVNGQPVKNRTVVKHGDRIRFGLDGPSLVLRFDPPPPGAPSRAIVPEVSAASASLQATRIERPSGSAEGGRWWTDTFSGRGRRARQPGTETRLDNLEREARTQTRRMVLLGGGLVLAVALLVAALLVDPQWLSFAKARTPEEAVLQNRDAVVRLELSWKVVDSQTGGQMFHWHVRNPHELGGGAWEPLRGIERVPVYVRFSDGGIEPVLIPESERQTNRAIGGLSIGTGFVVHSSGFLLANRRRVAPWTDPYAWPAESGPGIVVDLTTQATDVQSQPPPAWIPARARYVINRIPDLESIATGKVNGSERTVYGRADRFSAMFPGGRSLPATLQTTQDLNPVALARVTPLESLPFVRLTPQDTQPGGSSFIGLAYASKTRDDPSALTPSLVALRSSPSGVTSSPLCSGCSELVDSTLPVSAAGSPLFDSRGDVAAFLDYVEQRPVAVPIQYGWQIMGKR